MSEGNAPPGPATKLLNFVGEVQQAMDMPNLLLAQATLGVLQFLPKMPAARLFGDLVFQFGHTHPHPPTFGVPLPSTGPILAAGAVNVLINGLPAARNGDLGLAAWCGGYFPIFEVMFGSSHVFIGGSRAARMLMDPTLHCLPDFFNKGKAMTGMSKAVAKQAAKAAAKAAAKQLAQSVAITGSMKALQAAAHAEQAAASESEGEAEGQAAADAAADVADAAADALDMAMTALQMAADAAAAAMGALLGKDPGAGFPMGFIMMGSPNVLIGGFPMPGWSTVLKGFGKLLKGLIRKIQLKLPPGRLRNALCPLTGHPVEVVSGRMFTTKTDFEIPGRIPISFERIYDTSAIDYESALGWGWTHPFDQHLWESNRYNCLILRNEENRQVRFDKLAVGQKQFQPLERLWLERKGEAEYEIFDCKTGLFYKFAAVADAPDFKSEAAALRLTEIYDRSGSRVNLTYEDRLLVEIGNESGSYARLHYHETAGAMRLTEIRRHLKNGQNINLMRFGYNERAELISATDRTYAAYTYHYEDRLMTRETNRNNLSFYFEYEGGGPNARCVHTWGDGDIYDRRIAYFPRSRITKVKEGGGGEFVYHYDELDLVTKIFDAEGGISTFEYSGDSALLRETDELGRVRSYQYDEQLNCVGVAQPDGTTRRAEFNEYCQPLVITDEADGEWRREYDDRGNITATINPLGARREYDYDAAGDIEIFRDALGSETTLDWNAAGQIVSVVRPRGAKTTFSYDERSLVSEATDEFTGLKTTYQYDDAGRVKRVAEINARRETIGVQRYEYDDQSNLTLFVDALGNRTSYRYAGYDKIAERVDALGFRRRYQYDREERLTQIVNERGENYSFEYDLLDRITAETGFDGSRRSYQYNQAGELVAVRDALAREMFYRRDEMGRVTARLRSDATTVNYDYDECGRVVRTTNAAGEINLAYDAAWRLIGETQNGRKILSEYDAEDRRTARTTDADAANASRVEYVYDAEGSLTAVKIGDREIAQEYDAGGRLTTKRLPNGVREQYDYDAGGRLSGQRIAVGAGGREIVRRGYEWDALGNIIGVNDSLRGSRRYGYDAVERLSKVERIIAGDIVKLPDANNSRTASPLPADKRIWQADDRSGADGGQTREIEIFQYDGDGNLTERSGSARGTRRFAYGSGDKLERQEAVRYIYDAAGNLIQKRLADGTSIGYEYDADNQLIAVSTETGGKVEFKYDAFGRRTAKISDRGATNFLWDGDVLLAESKDSQIVTEYVHEGFVPLAKISNSQIELYHTDYLGTPKEVTDQNGEIVWQGSYDEYGKITGVRGRTEQNIRFQGQYEDAETGLFYNRHRYYDADGCRYINRDPIGLFGGDNLYAYGWNSLMWIDPYGLTKAPAKLPNSPGIYILTDEKTKTSYVGQGVAMNDRISSTSHKKAQKLLDTPGVKVQYIPVDLGTASSDADKRRILSRFEQIELDKQRDRGYKMLNSIEAEQPKKTKRNQDLIDSEGASGGKRRRTC